MASASSDNNKELPVIWLLPPPGLQPSKHSIPILPAIIAAIVTAIILGIFAFIPQYRKKRKRSKAAKESERHVALKSTIRVVRQASSTPVRCRADTSSEMFSAFQAEDYNKDSAHKPTQANAAATTPSSPRSYNIPSYYQNAEALNNQANEFATRALSFYPWQTPSSSIYSHSELYPAPLVISKSRGRDKVSHRAYAKDETWV